MNAKPLPIRTSGSSFQPSGGTAEFNAILQPRAGYTLAEQLKSLEISLDWSLRANAMGHEDVAFIRYFLSDVPNQKPALESSDLFRSTAGACRSIVGQAPLGGGSIALHAYGVKGSGITVTKPDADGPTLVETSGYQFIWSAGLNAPGPESRTQTERLFHDYESTLKQYGCVLDPDLIRTWIHVADVDNNYAGMVEARRDFFQARGLSKESHYVASTGIEATFGTESQVVSMDALAVNGLTDDQVVFMEAPENMCPTHLYGVTFERGTQLLFGDRKHLYVSGTASIDVNGEVMHVGDVSRQTDRTLDNVDALVSPHGCELGDFSHLLIYLRNPADYEEVKRVVERRVPADVPRLYLRGPVCRPTWLVEMEGIAVAEASSPFPNF